MTFLNNKRYFVLSFEAKEALAEQPLSLTSVQVLQLLSGNVQVHHLPLSCLLSAPGDLVGGLWSSGHKKTVCGEGFCVGTNGLMNHGG